MKRLTALALALLCLAPARAYAAPAEVTAPSAILMEKTTGKVLCEQNADAQYEPASVTKVMTLLLVMEAIDGGRMGWDDLVTASPHAISMGGSQIWLKENEQMSVRDMVKAVTVVSANDCAVALAEHVAGSEAAFVDRMNEKARELGMERTNFVNCTGLPAQGHLTCAYDIALMSRELVLHHPSIREFTTIWMDTLRDGAFQLSNTNRLIFYYEGATGLKTGFTDTALYCLSATAERDGMELIAVVSLTRSNEILEPDADNTVQIMKNLDVDFLVSGHVHFQEEKLYDSKKIFHPGAVGISWFFDGKTQYMILHGTQYGWEGEFFQLEYDVESVVKEFETSGLNQKAPYWSKINIHTLRTGIDKNSDCLRLAMKLCKEETGSVSWPDIPEKYWQQAVKEFGIDD